MRKNNQENQVKRIAWDMDELAFSLHNGKWKGTLEEAKERALLLVESCKHIFLGADLDPEVILGAIKEYEYIHEICKAPYLNAFLFKSSNVMDGKRNTLFQTIKKRTEQIYDLLTPLEIQFSYLRDTGLKKLADIPGLKDYRYIFIRLIKHKPYLLSESEERLIKSRKRSDRLEPVSRFDDLMKSLSFPKEIKGSFLRISADRALSFLNSSDRTIRQDVFKGFMGALGRNGNTYLSILNTLVYENNNESNLRGYHSPFHMSNMRNDIDPLLVSNMMDAVEENYPLVSKYYSFKSRFLGINDFKIFDIYAPIRAESSIFNFSEARQIILGALDAFHPAFASAARDIFDKKLIDAEARDNKQNGAFCKCLTPSQRPYISLKYTGSIRSILELAHEIGHAIQYALSAGKSYLNYRPAPVMSETASTFIETLVSSYILKSDRYRKVQCEVTASVIEGIILTVFRQNLITVFEKSIHKMRLRAVLGEHDTCEAWLDENRRLYGDSVGLTLDYRWGWSYIPHIIHHQFYCYSYVFGSLASLMLFKMYEKENKFSENIASLFESGATESPVKLLERIGVGIKKNTSWDFFFKYFEKLIGSIFYHGDHGGHEESKDGVGAIGNRHLEI